MGGRALGPVNPMKPSLLLLAFLAVSSVLVAPPASATHCIGGAGCNVINLLERVEVALEGAECTVRQATGGAC